ncbi:MAG: hypothetical protein OXH08_10205 [Gammaproteobacteria bacterium]|nr:hypothetical protein [Gammaproteobacteria bacterium]
MVASSVPAVAESTTTREMVVPPMGPVNTPSPSRVQLSPPSAERRIPQP